MHQDLKAAIQSDVATQIGAMSILHGGKTSPRFIGDLNRYNPHRLGPSFSYNVLTQLARTWEGIPPDKSTPKGSCSHKWALKTKQSSLPEYDTRPDHSTVYIVSAYCISCRCHVDLEVDYRREGAGVDPCPKEDAPLHHLKYAWVASNDARIREEVDGSEPWCDIQHFQCSDPTCSARVTTRYRMPRLTKEWVALLADKSLIRQRAQKAMADDPARFEGHAVPPPSTVITHLRTYIMNAMKDPTNPRRIQGNNKKWCLSLGEPCAQLLLYLGFTRDGDDWLPPCPDPPSDGPSKNPMNILLEDAEKELLVLLDLQSYGEKYISNNEHNLASREFERVLGSQGYKKKPSASRSGETQEEDHPWFAGLGATADFHDELISFAYDRQVDIDPANVPYYLECLQGIASGRNSEDLQTKAAIEASSGKFSRKDIQQAYDSLNLECGSAYLDDDFIIGTFQARISDAPKQEAEYRRALRIIGLDRSSIRIEQVASDSVTTYDQALAWLSVSPDIDDAFLTSMYSVKVNENPASEELARKAVSLIAEHRNSSALRQWLATGVLGEVEMDVGHAYNRLSIDDRTVDDDTILAAYNVLASDTPSQKPELKRALTAIADSKDSIILKSFLRSEEVANSNTSSEWPVGLENIGNTCYLNSLLQFYFTVKPLRDLVLNFDQYKMPIDEPSYENKRVGSRKVSKREVERAQRFVYELQKLFQNMISSPRAQVTPEQELARLTLISSSTEEHIRRQSTLSGNRPSLGEIYGRPIYGPIPPPAPQAEVSETSQLPSDVEMVDTAKDSQTSRNSMPPLIEIDDISSEGTLVDAPPPEAAEDHGFMIIDPAAKQPEYQGVQHDKENLAPANAIISQPPPDEVDLIPLLQQSPAQESEQASTFPPAYDFSNDIRDFQMTETVSPATAGPPSRPPPVPPRQKPEEHKKAIQEEVEIGAQQDVTEVIANVLFQLQCAIKPESIDESGEQIDQVKRLFYGKQKAYTTNEQGVIRTKEEFITDIKVDVASGPRDIYAALDGAFDVQEVEVGGSLEPQYTTISQLPPVLQIMVQRVQFDPEKKTPFKSIHHLELKETIYMDRYMDSADSEITERRQECWRWKKVLTSLENRRKELKETELSLEMPEVLAATGEYLAQLASLNDNDLQVDADLLKDFDIGAKVAKQEITALEDEIKSLSTNISSQFADLRTLPYSLHSVFIHRGLVSSGHYWIYIYDFAAKIWRKYNDGYVTKVEDPQREIYEAEASSRPATPYFLVYVKDDLKDELVDAVCRNVPPEVTATATNTSTRPGPAIQIDEPQDVIMKEGYKDENNMMNWVGNGAYEEPGETQTIDLLWDNSRTLANHDTW